MESNIWADSAPAYATFGTRDTFIGLSGALLGKLGNTLLSDPLLKTFSSANPADGNGNTLVSTSPFDTRRKNAIAYTSPT